MIDVHLLHLPKARSAWLQQAIASIKEAASRVDYPIMLHVLPGIPGDIGAARKAGYSLGDFSWKTYVDPDDYLLPNAFEDMEKYLHKDVVAIFPREQTVQNNKLHWHTNQGHHLQLYRKEFVEGLPFKEYPALLDIVAREEALKTGNYLDVEEVVYVHRLYKGSSARALRHKAKDEMTRLRATYG